MFSNSPDRGKKGSFVFVVAKAFNLLQSLLSFFFRFHHHTPRFFTTRAKRMEMPKHFCVQVLPSFIPTMSVPFEPRSAQIKSLHVEATSHSLTLSSSPLLAAATMLEAIIEAADAEKAQYLQVVDTSDHREDKDEEEEQRLREAHQATINPPALSSEGRPSRRPGRSFRKRERRVAHFSEGCYADPSSMANQPLRNTVGGPDAWRTSNVATNANNMVAPHSSLLPYSSAQASGHGRIQIDRGRPWSGQQFGTVKFPSAAAMSAAAALAAAAAAASGGAGTLYTRQTANTMTSVFSSSLSRPPRAQKKRCPPCFRPAPSLASSVTRLISSETYLRRLFVTASLAHVLSLDACLPRTMPARRKASSRVKEAGGREEEYNGEEEAGGQYGEQQDGAAGGTNDADANNADNKEPLNTATMPPCGGPFTIAFPVTLIDSTGQRWSIKYVTTRRDNLHSGRLADGWEKFCSANGLRIGDSVEFSRLEAHELSFQRVKYGEDAIAKVLVAYKKGKRKETKKGFRENSSRTAADPLFWHETIL